MSSHHDVIVLKSTVINISVVGCCRKHTAMYNSRERFTYLQHIFRIFKLTQIKCHVTHKLHMNGIFFVQFDLNMQMTLKQLINNFGHKSVLPWFAWDVRFFHSFQHQIKSEAKWLCLSFLSKKIYIYIYIYLLTKYLPVQVTVRKVINGGYVKVTNAIELIELSSYWIECVW